MGQAQWHLEGVKRMRTVPLSEMSTDPIGSNMLQMRMDATEQKSKFYQETMENMVLRAETVSTITQPEEPMRFERSGTINTLLVGLSAGVLLSVAWLHLLVDAKERLWAT